MSQLRRVRHLGDAVAGGRHEVALLEAVGVAGDAQVAQREVEGDRELVVVDVLAVLGAPRHEDRELAVLQRHQRDAGAGVGDHDVGVADRGAHLLRRHPLAAVDPEAGGVGATGLPQHVGARAGTIGTSRSRSRRKP